MQTELVKCSTISVDCANNDPVDIRAGGPQYLGFDFYVKHEDTTEMADFISETLSDLNVPLICLSIKPKERYLLPREVWTKERIYHAIKKDANFIIREAARNYGMVKQKVYVKK